MQFISIRDKLIVAFVLLSVTAVALVGGYAYQKAKSALTERTFDQLISVRVVKKRQIESYFRDRIKDINFLISSDEVNKIDTSKLSSLNIFRQFLDYNKYFKSISLLDKNSSIFRLHDTSSKYLQKYYDEGLAKKLKSIISNKHIHILDNSKVGQNHSQIFIIAPLIYSNSIIAVLFEIDASTINSIMLETNPKDGVGESGESYIVANDLLMRTQSRLHKSSPLNIKVETLATKDLMKGKEGTSEYPDYRNVKVLGSYSKLDISGLNWFVIAEIDLDEAFKPIVSLRNSILLITIIITAIVFLVTFILSRQVTIPIIKLTTATTEIGEGNYSNPLEIRTNDETGKLTEAFNRMIFRLKHSEDELKHERMKRLSASIDAIELERKRLSRELHDGLGQNFVAMKLQLESIDITKPDRASAILSDTKSAMKDSINEIRNISNDLMPAVLTEFGIANAVRNLCEEMSEYSPVKVACKTNLIQEIKSSRFKIYIFRIIQEALKNVVTHSKATTADVELITENHALIISVIDNGCGFDATQSRSGNGLYNIQERIALMGGEFILNSNSNSGTEIKAIISINRLYDEENHDNIS